MLFNWICLISIIALVAQVMFFFYMSAVSDLKTKRTTVKRATRPSYTNVERYSEKIAK